MGQVLPTLFLSHGSPMHALEAGRAGRAWAALGERLGKPRAVLVASAHWESEWPMVSLAAKLETLHDFGGFPEALYKLRYPSPGEPEVAREALELVRAGGIAASGNGCRGLDHGAWVPLLYMYPDADVPVVEISVQPRLGAAHHERVGAVLAPLREAGVLILGSGHLTHNLREWAVHARRVGLAPQETAPAAYVEAFRSWVDAALRDPEGGRLARWLEDAPEARRAHPTPEHFLPLPFAYGAAGPGPEVERFDLGVDAGVLALDAYLFHPREAAH